MRLNMRLPPWEGRQPITDRRRCAAACCKVMAWARDPQLLHARRRSARVLSFRYDVQAESDAVEFAFACILEQAERVDPSDVAKARIAQHPGHQLEIVSAIVKIVWIFLTAENHMHDGNLIDAVQCVLDEDLREDVEIGHARHQRPVGDKNAPPISKHRRKIDARDVFDYMTGVKALDRRIGKTREVAAIADEIDARTRLDIESLPSRRRRSRSDVELHRA